MNGQVFEVPQEKQEEIIEMVRENILEFLYFLSEETGMSGVSVATVVVQVSGSLCMTLGGKSTGQYLHNVADMLCAETEKEFNKYHARLDFQFAKMAAHYDAKMSSEGPTQ